LAQREPNVNGELDLPTTIFPEVPKKVSRPSGIRSISDDKRQHYAFPVKGGGKHTAHGLKAGATDTSIWRVGTCPESEVKVRIGPVGREPPSSFLRGKKKGLGGKSSGDRKQKGEGKYPQCGGAFLGGEKIRFNKKGQEKMA